MPGIMSSSLPFCGGSGQPVAGICGHPPGGVPDGDAPDDDPGGWAGQSVGGGAGHTGTATGCGGAAARGGVVSAIEAPGRGAPGPGAPGVPPSAATVGAPGRPGPAPGTPGPAPGTPGPAPGGPLAPTP